MPVQLQSSIRKPCLPRITSRSALLLALFGLATSLAAAPAFAQSLTSQEREEILDQLRQLREQQARISQAQQQTDQGIRMLEGRLGVASPAATVAAESAAPASAPIATAADRLTVTGDMRVRMQGDYSDNDAKNRNSSQVRARLGASYAVNETVSVGARIVTGDANDPNSTDVQLSNWDNDLQVSLDLAYVQLDYGALKLYGGKIPQPFARTDLVWDGDVNPQGASAVYKTALGNGGALRASGLLFPIDEQVAGPDSYMGGAQIGYDSPAHGPFKFDLSAGYYHYHLASMATADAGDWRNNRRDTSGHYLSDYRLLDLIGSVTWQGNNDRWPLRITGDYVRNLGADDENTGYSLDVAYGRASKPGDWRLTYGYAQTDVDAVLAAFSNDNIGIATNYKLHSLTVDYTPMPKTMVSAIWYHYKPNSALYAGANQPSDWLDRLRLFFLVNF